MLMVLGVDLAYTNWPGNGSATITFHDAQWQDCSTGVIGWPDGPITPQAMVKTIDDFVCSKGIAGVSLDGPQGWRDPRAQGPPERLGVGRLCEYETQTPGKTGTYGTGYPRSWAHMANFCAQVFEGLLQTGRAILANNTNFPATDCLKPGFYYVLECFPTSIWRSSGLKPLPGHRKAPPDVVWSYCNTLLQRYGLPQSGMTNNHDDLQSIVAALPAAAILGGPCHPIPRGEPAAQVGATNVAPAHRIEGLIWDAGLLNGAGASSDSAAPPPLAPSMPAANEVFSAARDFDNPLLPDERSPETSDVLQRGVGLFERLVASANRGQPLGVGYAQFVCLLYDIERFSDVCGRNYLPSDSGFVIRLAMLITEAAGGRRGVSVGDITIQAGMDTFIWGSRKPYNRPLKAWKSRWCRPCYTRKDWLKVFPDGRRNLVDK